MPVGEVLVGAEEVLQEGDVLAEPGALPKSGGRIGVVLALHIPELGLQGVDDVFPAHHVGEAATHVPAQVVQLMLRVQADHGFAGGQDVAQQEFQEETLALAGVAQNENVGVGLVLRPAVQIQDDVGAEAVLPDIEPIGVVFAGVIEREQIRHRGCGEDPLELGGENVAPRRVGG